jgi:hypothetical protein
VGNNAPPYILERDFLEEDFPEDFPSRGLPNRRFPSRRFQATDRQAKNFTGEDLQEDKGKPARTEVGAVVEGDSGKKYYQLKK